LELAAHRDPPHPLAVLASVARKGRHLIRLV
jgi:hypothetical protein